MKFAIGIPTLNRKDLLESSVHKYAKDFPYTDIHIVDNGKQNLCFFNNSIKVIEQQKNLGVAGSWNLLCDKIFEDNDYALIINDDVYLGYGIGTISDVIQSVHDGFVQSEHNFSVFLISKEFYKKIGKFDFLFYPAYYEDSDYIRRIELSNLKRVIDKRLNPKVAKSSQTYEKAPELVNKALKDNKERYIRKWGGLPLMETYTIPFDGNSTLLDILDLRDQQNIITEKINIMTNLEKYNKIINSTLKYLIRYNLICFKSCSIDENFIEICFTETMTLEDTSDLAEKIKDKYNLQSFIIDGNFFKGIKLILFI